MRRLVTGLFLLAALGGCGSSGQKAGNAAQAGPAGNASAAPAQTPAPAPPASTPEEARALAEFREDTLRGCIAGGSETAAPGTPVAQHCTCAVDRVMAGRSLAQLEGEERSGEHDNRFRAALVACIAEGPGPPRR